jgi:hypothetical protein
LLDTAFINLSFLLPKTRRDFAAAGRRLAWLEKRRAGTYAVNWGQRYRAELVNPIPRGLWQDKPLIGIDYAIARGQGWEGQQEGQAGVGATISGAAEPPMTQD